MFDERACLDLSFKLQNTTLVGSPFHVKAGVWLDCNIAIGGSSMTKCHELSI